MRDSTDVMRLTPDETDAARRLSARLIEELRVALKLLPVEARSTSAMADRLRVEKTTCHRIVSTLQSPGTAGPATLVELPGPKALRHFVAALRGAGHGDVELDGLSVAIDMYAQFLKDAGGSQAGFGRRLARSELPGERPVAPRQPRESDVDRSIRMHRDAAEVSGSDAAADVSVRVLRKHPGDPRRIEECLCRGFIGYTAAPRSRPLAVWSTVGQIRKSDGTATPHETGDLHGESTRGRTENSILRAFSSDPLPAILGIDVGHQRGVAHVIDPKTLGRDDAIDIVTLSRHLSAVPSIPDFRLADKEFWYLSNYPARHLLVDLYIEKSFFVMPNLPVVGCHTWDPSFETGNAPRWLSELPSNHSLSVLQPSIEQAVHDAYPRAADLTGHVFDALGADRSAFNGFRLHVPYPLWRTLYRISFDFVGGEPTPPTA